MLIGTIKVNFFSILGSHDYYPSSHWHHHFIILTTPFQSKNVLLVFSIQSFKRRGRINPYPPFLGLVLYNQFKFKVFNFTLTTRFPLPPCLKLYTKDLKGFIKTRQSGCTVTMVMFVYVLMFNIYSVSVQSFIQIFHPNTTDSLRCCSTVKVFR